MTEWTMTEEQSKKLAEIMQVRDGIEPAQLALVRIAGGVQKAQADWWIETVKALGIPEEYIQRLKADFKTSKITVVAPTTPGLAIPTPVATARTLTRP